jgi:hypothetical protein
MELSIIALSVLQSMAISLGVGSSTLAVVNFFYAISDGKIDETERNFMGVTYIVLRVAMGIILVTSVVLALFSYASEGLTYFTSYTTAQAILTAVLFINAYLMTIRVMPSTFGPAIQASSWYTLGFLMASKPFGNEVFNLVSFILIYAAVILLAITLINAIMAYLKDRREAASKVETTPAA